MTPVAVAGVLAGAVVGAALAGSALLVLGLRRRNPAVVGAVTRLQRSTLNPRQLERAGSPGARMSVVGHRGRRSGRHYRTPVGVRETGDAFLVLLPYGPGTDWVRNVRAAEGATLRHAGRTMDVDRPELVPVAAVARDLTVGDRATARLFGIREVLVLRPATEAGRR
jgi:deazaflavin-dependent oxidoreductase (nitroreductase family)